MVAMPIIPKLRRGRVLLAVAPKLFLKNARPSHLSRLSAAHRDLNSLIGHGLAS